MPSSPAYEAFMQQFGRGNPAPVALSTYNGWLAAGSPASMGSYTDALNRNVATANNTPYTGPGPAWMTSTPYGGMLTNTNTVLSGMNVPGATWSAALNKYLSDHGGSLTDTQWMGDAAMTRAYLQGLASLDPAQYGNVWTNYTSQPGYNPAIETQQQQAAGALGNRVQAEQGSDPLVDPLFLAMFGGVAGGALAGAGALGGGAGAAATEGATSLGSLGSGTFGLDLGGLGGTAAGSTGLGSLGVGATGTGAVTAGGGALGTGLAGLGAADLGAAGLGSLAGAGAGATSLGSVGATPPPSAPSIADAVNTPPTSTNLPTGNITTPDLGGTTITGSGGNNVDWLDEILNFDTGPTIPTSSEDPLAGLFNNGTGTVGGDVTGTTGSDWSTGGTNPGSGNVMTPGSAGSSGLPSWLTNMPTSPLKSLFTSLFGGSGTGLTTGGSNSGMSALATLLGGGLDAYGASKYADNMKAISDRNWNAGAPFRQNATDAATMGFNAPGFQSLIQPAMDQATQTYLRQLSATGGNPAGIGAAPSQTQAYVLGNVGLPAFQNFFNSNSNAGGLSSLAADSSATGMAGAQAGSSIYNSLGKTATNIANPQMSLRDLLSMSTPV